MVRLRVGGTCKATEHPQRQNRHRADEATSERCVNAIADKAPGRGEHCSDLEVGLVDLHDHWGQHWGQNASNRLAETGARLGRCNWLGIAPSDAGFGGTLHSTSIDDRRLVLLLGPLVRTRTWACTGLDLQQAASKITLVFRTDQVRCGATVRVWRIQHCSA